MCSFNFETIFPEIFLYKEPLLYFIRPFLKPQFAGIWCIDLSKMYSMIYFWSKIIWELQLTNTFIGAWIDEFSNLFLPSDINRDLMNAILSGNTNYIEYNWNGTKNVIFPSKTSILDGGNYVKLFNSDIFQRFLLQTTQTISYMFQ